MKACVLYSGGKDSSLMAIILKNMGFDVDLVTANFGVYDSYLSASASAKDLGLNHVLLKMDIAILNNAIAIIKEDGFPNNGINYIHKNVLDEVANTYDIVADGTRRDDKVPKLSHGEIQSLEDRKKVQYVNLNGFGHKTIETLVSKLFKIKHEKSNRDNSSDYEVEIRILIDELGGISDDIFPEHYQTKVVGFK
ncbi:DUF7411 family protein [Methanobrevibacter filiformis]|uniref:7-cyano-7-deazaguanine synthase n=1 Tax=Methanobrevibacter filiformis TaxID=55758 RepID=A0A166E2W3_9EURY|nr:hypothetical protein [Methanobrevibacter filiformis]KZX16221.1 hypothetical protein MBFIL_05510 [Methanobrevibacter filiformis]